MRLPLIGIAAVLLSGIACGESSRPRVGVLYPANSPPLDMVRHSVLARDVVADDLTPTMEFAAHQAGEDVDQVLAASEWLIAERAVSAVVGPGGSRGAIAAASVFARAGVPLLVPNATSRRLASTGEWTFRLAPDDQAQGRVIAEYALDSLHASRVAIVYVSDEYGVGLRDGVAELLERRNVGFVDEVVIQANAMGCRDSRSTEALDLVAYALVERAHPDVVILAVGGSVGGCLAQFFLSRDPLLRVVTSDGVEMLNDDLQKLDAASKRRVSLVVMWEPRSDGVNTAFLKASRTVHSADPNPSDALVYDAFALVAAAVREVGPKPHKVRAWLESLGRDREPWMGVTGPISFAPGARDAILRVRPLR